MKKPIFVDHTGRRRRAAIVVGSGLGVLLVLGLVMLGAGLMTGSPVPLPGWPDAVQVDGGVPVPAPAVQRSPAQSTPASPKKSTTPEAVPTTGAPGNGNGNGHGRPSKPPGKP